MENNLPPPLTLISQICLSRFGEKNINYITWEWVDKKTGFEMETSQVIRLIKLLNLNIDDKGNIMENRKQQQKALLEIQKNNQHNGAPTAQIMFDMKKGSPTAILITSWIEFETVNDKHGLLQGMIRKEFGSRDMITKIISLQHIWGIWQISKNPNLPFEFHRQENGDHPAGQKYTWCEITYEIKNPTPLIRCHRCHTFMCEHDQNVCGPCLEQQNG
ncbi:MAG: hypothetical protein L3J58_11760 [Emcibacter sp.]|nr:hypothetical protein [Emcibacter sp.]